MLKEIQRLAVLSIFFYIYIQAQEVQNVGANIEVKDPFAKPNVDPFASMKTSGSASTTKTESKTGGVGGKQGDPKKPVVDAGNIKASNRGESSSRTTSEISSTSTSAQTKDVKTISVTGKSGGNTDTRGRVTTSRDTSVSAVRQRDQTERRTNAAGTSGIGGRSQIRESQTRSTGNTAARVDQNTGTKTNVRTNQVNVMDVDMTRDSTNEGKVKRRRLRNRAKGGNRRSESSNVVRRTKIDATASNALDTSNTQRDLNRDRNSILGNDFLNSRISNQGRNMGTVPALEEPFRYVRKLYRDQRICENCIGDCYLEHPEDCRKYIRCSASSPGAGMEALIMDCAFGTFWSNEANTCDSAPEVRCKNDPCRDTRLKTYPSGINCRSYWRCVNGRSDSECCPIGEAFVDGTCVPSDSCKVDDNECPYKFRKHDSDLPFMEEVMNGKEKANHCALEAVPGDITAYKNNNHWATMRCADGTRFDAKQCTCVSHVFNRVRCKPIADIEFETEPKNKEQSYIKAQNVTIKKPDGALTGYGLFNGQAFIAVPHFENNQNIGTHFAIRMRFYYDGNAGYDSQVLASNCKTTSRKELSPSFAILLAKPKKEIIFFASTKTSDRSRYGATKSISLPYQPGSWTVVELKFLDEILHASVETLKSDGTSEIVRDEKQLKGKLTTSVMPLMVGNCNMNDGFVGYVDMVKMYTCNPDQAR